MIHHSSNAVYLLPAHNAVARITAGKGGLDRAQTIYDVTRWLTEQESGSLATAPLPDAGPVGLADATVVSFWEYYPQGERPEATSAHLAGLLHRLHSVSPPPFKLPTWTPLESLHGTLVDDQMSVALRAEERRWLMETIEDIRLKLASLDWPLGSGLIHGDAWAGNMLWHGAAGPDEVVLGDWDWVSYGPREVDLIPTWHASIRYGRDEAWVRAFVDQYGYDLSTWHGYETLLAMRDLVQITGPTRRANDAPHHAARLRQRLTSMRTGDRRSSWTTS